MGKPGLADILPLSPLQEGLLFHSLYEEGTPRDTPGDPAGEVYSVQFVLRLTGTLDAGRLRTAVSALLERHPNLRAAFRTAGLSRPVQVIPHAVTVPWQEIDLRHLDTGTGSGAAELAAVLEADRTRRFDLAVPPLVRAVVVRTAADEWHLGLTMHHIVIDGWSLPVVVEELVELYRARGDAARLPRVTGYREYLGWLAARDTAAAVTAWRAELAGLDGPTLLAAQRPAAAGPAPTRTAEAELDGPTSAALVATARTLGLTMNTIVQCAWAVLLSRLTGRDDVTFGSTVSGRPAELPGVESMVGLFINTVPVRVVLDQARPVAAVLADLQTRQTALLDHQHLGLAEIQRAVGRPELFDTLCVYENYPVDPDAPVPTADGLVVADVRAADSTHYPACLVATRTADRLRLTLTVAPGRLDHGGAPDVAALLLRRLGTVLSSIAADPSCPLGRIDAMPPIEREHLLLAAGGDAEDYPEATIVELFAEQVAANPDAPAVSAGADGLTYGELDARANRLARLLIARGAGPERFVALALPRGAEMIVALLAVLKSGAGYLPMDPEYPAARLAHMLADCGPVLVVTSTDTADRLPPSATPQLLLDDAGVRAEWSAADPGAPEVPGLDPASPAYVIYTSGSTGRPKGVVIPHQNVVRLFFATDHWFTFGPADVWTMFHSYAFDFSVWEIWGPLLFGGRLVVVDHATSRSPEDFLDLLVRERVTVLNQTPSAFYQLMTAERETPGRGAELSLRAVVFGGEALELWRLGEWFDRHPHLPKMINMYGITETTVHVSYIDLDRRAVETSAGSLIGVGLPDLRVHVLDSALRPTLTGVAGEMYVAGGGLARGYLNRPDLTAARFVTDPYGPSGTRMYRTGDVARRLTDGSLEFVGRADSQVKIRGFRIELGEVEAALAAHADVADVAVLARQDQPGDRRLVAYVVPARAADLDAAELRAFAATTLPEHMVPSAVVVLPAMPLTPNGKLDRAALPAPDPAALAPRSGRAARTPAEEILCGLFAEVLGLPGVGVDDDFFAAGGHSLLATRLVSRVRSVMGVELGIRALFEAATPALLAERLATAGSARTALRPVDRPATVPLAATQMRLWFLNHFEREAGVPAGTYNLPIALRLAHAPDVDALQAALGDLVARHESLRTVHPDVDGVPYQSVLDAAAAVPPLTAVAVRPDELDAALAVETARGFDLATETPVRAYLFAIDGDPRAGDQGAGDPGAGANEHVLLLVLHHIAADGWSRAPLARDLSVAYGARCAGTAPQLAPLPVQYVDYALWQRELLGDPADPGSEAARQLDFWRGELSGAPAQLVLPTDRPRPAVRSYRGATTAFELPAALHAELVASAAAHRCTVFMVLQAGVAALLTRLGAGTDIPLGTAVAGRTDEALDPLVGFFVNTLVLRTDTSGAPSFAALLESVRRADLAAYSHQDVAFDAVVDALHPERSTAHHPLFQVMLTLENNAAAEVELPGVPTTPQPVGVTSAKFDLSFGFEERTTELGDPAGILGALDYDLDLFDPATVDALADRLTRLLVAVAAQPRRPITTIDLLTERERALLLPAPAAPAATDPAPATVVALFTEQARRTPSAPAVGWSDGPAGGGPLTYAELDERSTRLAHLLAARGLGPEQFAAIALPRTELLVVALLAVLRTGAGYLPLEPGHPADRIAFMLSDTRPQVLLTTTDLAPALPATDAEVIALDDPGLAAAQPAGAVVPLDRSAAGHPAYVIYTSGSTGRPKGVVIEHRALAAYLGWTRSAYPGTEGMALVHSPISFDLTVTALYTCLTTGGRVQLTALEEGDATAQVLAAQPSTFLKATPSHVPLLAALPDTFSPSGHLLLGGELLLGESLAEFRRRNPRTTVLNVYGQTESTVNCAEYRIEPGQQVPAGALPVGRPFPGVRLYVLDARLQPVAPGVTGEVYVGGDQLARGYLERRALTAERFVADPFGPPGSRMYRSGDLASWRRDGLLVFVGRADHQVKIRGFRIELGEIEAVLARRADVAQAAVVVREDRPGDRRLVAYVVPAGDDHPVPGQLQGDLAAALPDYMVPAATVLLDALPLTPNGKLDRAALPRPDAPAPARRTAPRNGREETLAGLFAELLGAAEVGVEDGFFDLGGDSIISIQLVSRARRAGLVITPKQVFEHRTVAALALVATDMREAAHDLPDDGVGPVPLTPAVSRFRDAGGPITGYAQSMLLHVPAGLGAQRLERAVQTLLDHHDVLRLRLRRAASGGDWQTEVAERGAVRAGERIVRVEAAGLDGARLRALVSRHSRDAWALTDPDAGQMVRVVWFDAGPDAPGRLLVVAHHLVVDGVSWRILVEDLRSAWEGTALQPVGTSFRRWAEHLRELAHDDARLAELPTWARITGTDDPPLGERELDPGRDVLSTVELRSIEVPPQVADPLLVTLPAAFGAGPHEVLLTALALAVAEWRQGRDRLDDLDDLDDLDEWDEPDEPDRGNDAGVVLVDLEGHGRQDVVDGVDLSRTVGWFTARYPVAVPVAQGVPGRYPDGPALGAGLKRVKEQLRSLPDSGLGYGLLRHLNHDTRAVLASSPDPQVSFNYLGRFPAGSGTTPQPWTAVQDADVIGGADLLGGRPDPRTPCAHALAVNALAEERPDGLHLKVVFSWPRTLLRESDTAELVACWDRALAALAEYARSGAQGGLSPSDVGLVALDQQQLDDLEDEDGFDGDLEDDTTDDDWEMAT